jgi:hypothetical protein
VPPKRRKQPERYAQFLAQIFFSSIDKKMKHVYTGKIIFILERL